QRAHGVDLGDDHAGAHAAGAGGEPLADPAVAAHDEDLARDEHRSGAQHAVERRLARAVAVVEEVLRHGVVDGYERVGQDALGRHAAEAVDARRGLLGAREHVRYEVLAHGDEARHEVAAVVHGDGGLVGEHRVDVLVVLLVVDAAPRVDVDAALGQRRGDVVLRGERVAAADRDLGAAGLERLHEHRRLLGDVQARADGDPLERLRLLELLADEREHGHVRRGPVDALAALLREIGRLDAEGGDGHRAAIRPLRYVDDPIPGWAKKKLHACVYAYTNPMTKTVSMADDAYDALLGVKRPGESFSDVARRLARLAALDDVFDPSFRLEGDGRAWKDEVRRARDRDARPRADLG